VLALGAGRQQKGDTIDPRVGIVLHRKGGTEIRAGETVAEIHAASREAGERAAGVVASAYTVQDEEPELPPRACLRITPEATRTSMDDTRSI
jgi:thymidine phosphorylase